jgi:hypothetical protein
VVLVLLDYYSFSYFLTFVLLLPYYPIKPSLLVTEEVDIATIIAILTTFSFPNYYHTIVDSTLFYSNNKPSLGKSPSVTYL